MKKKTTLEDSTNELIDFVPKEYKSEYDVGG